jgi:DNA-binding IclR family transcriptional regulator
MDPDRPAAGSQTLARGLRALELVAAVRDGLTIQEIADRLEVHRSIASRLLATLADHRLVVRGADGRFRTGAGLAALAAGTHAMLRAVAEPVMRELAERLGATVMLVIAEADQALPLAIIDPPSAGYVLTFRTGSRHPLDRGSAGLALRAASPARPGEPDAVAEARERGYASTHSEVVEGAYGVAAPLPPKPGIPPICLNVVTYRLDIAEIARDAVVAAARRISAALA